MLGDGTTSYRVIAAPPSKPGAVKLISAAVAEVSAAVPITGAAGATACTLKLWLTCTAGSWLASPA